MLKNEALSINQVPGAVCKLIVVAFTVDVAFLFNVIVFEPVLKDTIEEFDGKLALLAVNEEVIKLKLLTEVIIFEPLTKLPVIEFGKLLKVVTDRDPFLSDDILF